MRRHLANDPLCRPPLNARHSFRLFFALLLIAAICVSGPILSQSRPETLPTLTSIRSIHLLGYADALRGYPVRVRGIVTYYDPITNRPGRPTLMVTSEGASIFVALVSETTLPLKAGARVEVTGRSGPGDFAAIIDQAQIRILEQADSLPPAPRESLTHLLSGSQDAEWSEMEGVVESVEETATSVTLKLGLVDGVVTATTLKEPGADYAHLIDSEVTIRGVAGSLFNRKRQMLGVRLLFPNLSVVHVERPAPEYPYDTPISPIGDLLRFTPHRVFNHRVHLRGAVTLFWPGRLVCIQTSHDALCADTLQTSPLPIGQQADLIGFPKIGDLTPTLVGAQARALPDLKRDPAVAVPIDGTSALSGERDSQLVQLDGILVAHDLASQDNKIVLSSGKTTFPVILPSSSDAALLLGLQEGTRLRVTGICFVGADSKLFTSRDGYPVARYFRIMLRSTDDITILQRPSWWNARHTLRVLALALVAALCGLCWVILLRNRVKQQTQLLRHQATHDALTGIWNRRAICDMLQREFEVAARAQSRIGIMMLDADNFKHVNDTYGHQAGDAVLKELARRTQIAVRSFDLTGRYGGEEFLVIVPGCTREQVMQCAERIRAAIAGDTIDANGVFIRVTVSIGTAVLDPARNSQHEALAAADHALYRAKSSGRDCVCSGDPGPRDISLVDRTSQDTASATAH